MKHRNYKVLVPIDFSEHSRHAVQYVLSALANQVTHVYLLHAYKERTPGNAPLISLIDILREKSERLMQIELKQIEPLLLDSKIELHTFSRFDGYLHSINDIIEKEGIDLVAIGSNGHTHPRMDSRDDDPGFLLHKINKPLLLVPKIAN
jgi:nucleotide-binding universal stress UspA family protein